MKSSGEANVLRKKQHLMRQALNLASGLPDDLNDAQQVLDYMSDIYFKCMVKIETPPCVNKATGDSIRLVPTAD